MRRRLLVSTALIALAAVLLLGVPLGVVGGRLERSAVTDRLEHEADEVAAALDDHVERHEPVTPALLARLAPAGRLVVVRLPDGHVVRGGAPLKGDLLQARAGGSTLRVTMLAAGSEAGSRTRKVWLAVLVLSLIALAVAAGLALAQSRRLARPLERLARRSTRIGTPVFDRAAEQSGVPEVDELGSALDHAAARIDRLLAREREFSANASHQLRTPLTALRMHLEELERIEPADGDAGLETKSALAQVDRLRDVIVELERLARDSAGGEVEELDAAALAREQAASWRTRYEAAGRPLAVQANGPLPALAGPSVRQALDVLLDNALRHGAGGVTLTASPDAEGAVLAVADEGPGVPPERAAHVFERGVSLAGSSGLGLAVARELLEAAGGDLRIGATPATFEIVLPGAPRGGRTAT